MVDPSEAAEPGVHEELRQARAAAEAAALAKSEFLSVMSHELRTPLTAVMGYAELLEAELVGPLNERQQQYVDRIRASSWQLRDLINELLDFATIQSGSAEIELGATDAAAVARAAGALIQPRAAAKNLTLEVRAEEPLVIRTDPGKLRHILVNLLSNGVKFTERGSVSLRAFRQGDRAVFEVTDTGPGIAPQHQARIFEPFTQVDSSTTRSYGGTGLGLAISREFARLLGGELSLRPGDPVGSTFRLALPT